MIDPSTPGLKVMLIGAAGSGKTTSLKTLIDAGLEVFGIFTEPGYIGILGDTPKDKFHWAFVPPAAPSFKAMIDAAKKINMMDLQALSSLPAINKREYQEFIKLLVLLENFKDERTGKEFGSVEAFDNSKVLVLDSLSGLNEMALNLQVGGKPVKNRSDWGIAMDSLGKLIMRLCVLNCHVVITAHPEKETDEVTGAQHVMMSTLGQKLAPKLPRFFDEVINTVKKGKEFYWSTTTFNMDLKQRILPLEDEIPPTFAPAIETWRQKVESGEPLTHSQSEVSEAT